MNAKDKALLQQIEAMQEELRDPWLRQFDVVAGLLQQQINKNSRDKRHSPVKTPPWSSTKKR